MIERIKKHSLSFWYLNLMIIILVLLPKSNAFLEKLPIRIGLLAFFSLIVLYEYKKHIITFNNSKLKFLNILYVLFIIATIPSLFVTKSIVNSLYTIVKFIMFYLTYYFVCRINFSDEEKKWFYKSLLGATILTIIYGFISYFTGYKLFTLSNYMYPGSLGRIRTTFFNPCYYATYINLVFALLIYKLCEAKDKKNVLFYLITISLLFTCLIFAFTRSAVLVFLVLLIMMLVLFWKIIFKFRSLILLLICSLLVAIIPAAPHLFETSASDGMRFLSSITNFLPDFISKGTSKPKDKTKFKDASLQDRESYAIIAKRIAKDNPLTGVGIGSYINYMNSKDFDVKYPDYTSLKIHPHSSLLLIYAEAGTIAIIPFVLFLIVIVFKFFNFILCSFTKKDKLYYYSSIAFMICCGFMVVSVMSENSMYDTQIFPLFLIIIGILYSSCINELNKSNRIIVVSNNEKNYKNKKLNKKYDVFFIGNKKSENKRVYKLSKNKVLNFIELFILFIFVRPKYVIFDEKYDNSDNLYFISKKFDSSIISTENNNLIKTDKIIYKLDELTN